MIIDIATQDIASTVTVETAAGGITLHDSSYGLSITPIEGGFQITDETGGDAEAPTPAEALAEAAEFIENVAEEDAGWMSVAAHLRSIAGIEAKVFELTDEELQRAIAEGEAADRAHLARAKAEDEARDQ